MTNIEVIITSDDESLTYIVLPIFFFLFGNVFFFFFLNQDCFGIALDEYDTRSTLKVFIGVREHINMLVKILQVKVVSTPIIIY